MIVMVLLLLNVDNLDSARYVYFTSTRTLARLTKKSA